jgi:hypothetical protein
MAKETKIDEWEVRDLEDDSVFRILVEHCEKLGNDNKPGLRIRYVIANTGYYFVVEPRGAAKWVYKARKASTDVYVVEDHSWLKHEDQFIRNSIVIAKDGALKARVEVKVKSASKPKLKEYDVPFKVVLDE